jgi:hypothetical protein
LIALIINARLLGSRTIASSAGLAPGEQLDGWTLIRKTSFASDRSDGVRSSSRQGAAHVHATRT